jgi:hypothetical protein
MADRKRVEERERAEDLGLDPHGDRRATDATTAAPTDRAAKPARSASTEEANPPHTTTGKITAPKFGSAGSGGLEYEGPLKKD